MPVHAGLVLLVSALAAGLAGGEADPVLAARERLRAIADLLSRAYVFIGNGSGVVIDPTGRILTNHHVAGDRPQWRVRLANGHSAEAEILGTDPVGDICLLQMKPDENGALPPFAAVSLAREQDLSLGQAVIAIGNPFGLGDIDNIPSVSAGVLGAIRVVRGQYSDCLQLDAPVNPGNSGGPLLDLDGRLLGINGQIRTRTGMRINSGIGLAIACTQLAAFLPHLAAAEGGFIHHTAIPPGLELAQTATGVEVKTWRPRDPAHQDLLRAGDRLLTVAGRTVTSQHDALGCFAGAPWTSGVRIAVRLGRAGEMLDLSIPAGRTTIPGRPWHGLTFSARNIAVKDPATGAAVRRDAVLVTGIDPESPAAKAGIAIGLRVVSLNGIAVDKMLAVYRATAGLEVGDRLVVVVAADDGTTASHRLMLLPK